MTMPNERFRAIVYARDFLRDLLDKSKTPRVPLYLRVRARSVLKHMIAVYELETLAKACPKILEVDKELVEQEYGKFRELLEKPAITKLSKVSKKR